MTRIHAIFDGHVLQPEESCALEANKRYLLTVEDEPVRETDPSDHLLLKLAAMATDLGVVDLAERHDYYKLRR